MNQQMWIELVVTVAVLISVVAGLLYFLFKLAGFSPEQAIGVSPRYRPFDSYEEFSVARLEMNLEEFLDRASATPESVKTKPVSIVSAFQQAFRDIELSQLGGGGSAADAGFKRDGIPISPIVCAFCSGSGWRTPSLTPCQFCKGQGFVSSSRESGT